MQMGRRGKRLGDQNSRRYHRRHLDCCLGRRHQNRFVLWGQEGIGQDRQGRHLRHRQNHYCHLYLSLIHI